jgi:hypothetical protein
MNGLNVARSVLVIECAACVYHPHSPVTGVGACNWKCRTPTLCHNASMNLDIPARLSAVNLQSLRLLRLCMHQNA